MKEPQKSKDMRVTMENLTLTRREFKSDISVLRNEMQAGFKSVDVRFNGIDSKLHQLSAEIAQMRSESSRTLALVEEGRVESRYLMDALSFMWKGMEEFSHSQ